MLEIQAVVTDHVTTTLDVPECAWHHTIGSGFLQQKMEFIPNLGSFHQLVSGLPGECLKVFDRTWVGGKDFENLT